MGGNGTLREVVNGFFATGGTSLAPLRCARPLAYGTGSDFRRALGVPAAPAALERLSTPRTRSIDLLKVAYATAVEERAYRYALNMVSTGLSERVVHRLQRDGDLLPFARLRCVEALLRVLAAHRPFRAVLEVDGTPVPASALHMVAVANRPSFGAGLRIAPDAVLDDGRLAVTVLHDVSALALLGRLHHFYRGTHPSLRDVTTRPGRRLHARSRQVAPVLVEADGELLGRLLATVETVPDALRLQY